MNEKELDLRLRDALLEAVSAEYSLLPDEEEPPLPIGLLRRMRPLLADPFGRRRRTRRRAGRAAVAALLALSVSFGTLVAVNPQARAWVQRMVIQFLDRHAAIHFVGDSPSGELGNWAPTWLPEGYELVTESLDPAYSILSYAAAPEQLISLHYMPASGNAFNIDNEHHEQTTIQVNGVTAFLYQSLEPTQRSSLVWEYQEQNIAFLLLGDLSVDDLIKLAESIEKN